MINIKPCRGCGRPLIEHRVANLAVRLEPTPLDLNGIMGELAASRSLWMVDAQKVRPARPGEAGPLREHRCPRTAQEALSRPSSTTPGPSPQSTPQKPSAGRTAPSSGPQTAHSSVRRAGRAPSRPRCDWCSRPMDDGTYASVQVGELVVWAEHVTREDCTP